jgi:NADH:ubiquinone oxidoreductase subunit 6 (subunit J)
MLLNLRSEDGAVAPGRVQRFLFLPAAAVLAAALLYALVRHRIPCPGARPVPSADFGTVERIGRLLFTDYLFAFEFASLLLVVAMIGAVMLAKRHLD